MSIYSTMLMQITLQIEQWSLKHMAKMGLQQPKMPSLTHNNMSQHRKTILAADDLKYIQVSTNLKNSN